MAATKRTEATKQKLMTAEELLRLPDNGKMYELLDGVLIEMSPPGAEHGGVMSNVSYALQAHVRANALGTILDGDPGIFLRHNPDRVRAPDVCFIARERMPASEIPRGYLDLVPDLIVEIISPNDTAAEVEQKVEEWLREGARLVWAVYPDTRSVVAYHGLASVRIFTENETLAGEDVLPGFAVPVAEFFS
jgi:Uma2 family endonuclease